MRVRDPRDHSDTHMGRPRSPWKLSYQSLTFVLCARPPLCRRRASGESSKLLLQYAHVNLDRPMLVGRLATFQSVLLSDSDGFN